MGCVLVGLSWLVTGRRRRLWRDRALMQCSWALAGDARLLAARRGGGARERRWVCGGGGGADSTLRALHAPAVVDRLLRIVRLEDLAVGRVGRRRQVVLSLLLLCVAEAIRELSANSLRRARARAMECISLPPSPHTHPCAYSRHGAGRSAPAASCCCARRVLVCLSLLRAPRYAFADRARPPVCCLQSLLACEEAIDRRGTIA